MVLNLLGGGADLPPPTKNRILWAGGSKIELEPHILQRLMPDKRIYHFQTPRTTPTNGLKSDFFWWFMRFVRVPLMKVGQIGPTFLVPEKTVNFFRVKPAVSSFTLKMRKSHKKLARVYAYTHAYTQIRDGGGKYAPPR